MLERKGRPILGRLEAMLGTQRIKVIEENVHLPPSTPTLTTPRHCSALFCGPSVKGGKTERFDWEGKGRGGRRGKQAILLGNQTNGGSTQRQPKVGEDGGWGEKRTTRSAADSRARLKENACQRVRQLQLAHVACGAAVVRDPGWD